MAEKNSDASHLATGLYWRAEKLMWGYEGVEKDAEQAFRLYRQASRLGLSDAEIRVGQLREYGKGTTRDPRAAIRSYAKAARMGNFSGFAFLAKLLEKTIHLERAGEMWSSFFSALNTHPDAEFMAASRGELLHVYITSQLARGLEPSFKSILWQYLSEIVGYHQQLLEHAPDQRLERLAAASDWIAANMR